MTQMEISTFLFLKMAAHSFVKTLCFSRWFHSFFICVLIGPNKQTGRKEKNVTFSELLTVLSM
ncbi:hypothetical protein ABNB63_13460 [Paenibacillus larvae]